MESLDEFARRRLREIKATGLLRALIPYESNEDRLVRLGDREYLDFCSNDYLGLAGDSRLAVASRRAVDRFGTGATASPLIRGYTSLLAELEAALAEWKGTESALVFSSGFSANVGVLTALTGPEDVIFSDALNHASLIDACRLSRARVVVYPHGDFKALGRLLQEEPVTGRRFIVTDGVFSMDGDLAPLPELVRLKERCGAVLYVDDAHGTGAVGETGAGTAEYLGCRGKVDIAMGTLSKALGAQGGFVATSAVVRELLFNTSRSYIYSTGLAPSACAAALEAVGIARDEPRHRERLQRSGAVLLREVGGSSAGLRRVGHIVPVVIGSNEDTMKAAETLREQGILVVGIRYPTVPKGTARLRITLSARHSDEDIDRLLAALRAVNALE